MYATPTLGRLRRLSEWILRIIVMVISAIITNVLALLSIIFLNYKPTIWEMQLSTFIISIIFGVFRFD